MYDLNETQAEVAIAALNKMLRQRYFDICTIDSVAKMLGVNPRSESYAILRPLHCVDYADMSASLKAKLPALIADCLGEPPMFQFTLPTKVVTQAMVIVPVAETPTYTEQNKPGLFKRLQIAFKG